MKKTKLLKSQEDHHVTWSAVMQAPFGKLGIKTGICDDSLMIQEIFYVSQDAPLQHPTNALAQLAIRQIEHYLVDPSFTFDLPLIPYGTNHQNRVWREISGIPLGQVTTYGALAKAIKSAPRAVGQACGSNPYPIVVPCHRVIAATGIGGFARHDEEGYHRSIKTWLLQHEGVIDNTKKRS